MILSDSSDWGSRVWTNSRFFGTAGTPPQLKAWTAAVTVIPGVVFSPGLDGWLRALSATTGRVVWEFNTAQDFTTVNGVKARGGSIGSAGAVVVDGMLYVTSGYIGFQNGVPGNVLLAFGLTD